MRYILTFFTSSILLFSSAFSQEEATTESWYTYWGLGYASVSYPDELQEVIDVLKDNPEISNLSLSLDMLGFYWHVTPKLIGGFIINGVGDRFAASGNSMQINQYIYGASAMYYPGPKFGSGIFLRSDIGVGRLVVTSSGFGSAVSESGFGILGGGGWSFDLGGTRLLLNANYAHRSVESESYGTFSISVGGLF